VQPRDVDADATWTWTDADAEDKGFIPDVLPGVGGDGETEDVHSREAIHMIRIPEVTEADRMRFRKMYDPRGIDADGKKAQEMAAKVSAQIVETVEKADVKAKTEKEELGEQIREDLRSLAKASEFAFQAVTEELPQEIAAPSDSFPVVLESTSASDSLEETEAAAPEAPPAADEDGEMSKQAGTGMDGPSFKIPEEAKSELQRTIDTDEPESLELAHKSFERFWEPEKPKRRGLFGFLRRKKGKEGAKKTKTPAKKARRAPKAAKGRAAKRGLFRFLRRKKAVDGDGAGTA
jgi:hypothetical protein